MKPDFTAELVRLRLEQARETLADARALLDANRTPRSVVNRAYYAMFYAVLGLLQSTGQGASKHAGVISLFDRDFVHSGRFPVDASRVLHELFDKRQQADYEPVRPTGRDEAGELLAKAERFVAQVQEYLDRKPIV